MHQFSTKMLVHQISLSDMPLQKTEQKKNTNIKTSIYIKLSLTICAQENAKMLHIQQGTTGKKSDAKFTKQKYGNHEINHQPQQQKRFLATSSQYKSGYYYYQYSSRGISSVPLLDARKLTCEGGVAVSTPDAPYPKHARKTKESSHSCLHPHGTGRV